MSSPHTAEQLLQARLAANPGQAYGLFAPADEVEQLPLDCVAVRTLALALAREAAARAELAASRTDVRAAIAGAHASGARVTQLAAVVGVSRPTIRAAIRAERLRALAHGEQPGGPS